jgi:hypothetical protein
MSQFERTGDAPVLVELSFEQEWPALRVQLDLAPDPSLIFAFVSSVEQQRELLKRAKQRLEVSGFTVDELTASERSAVVALPILISTPRPDDRQLWVLGVSARGAGGEGGDRAAWESCFLRCNDRRDALLRAHPLGIVWCLPLALKPLIRDTAPDLWAKRSLSIEIGPPASLGIERPSATSEQQVVDDLPVTIVAPSHPIGRAQREHESQLAGNSATPSKPSVCCYSIVTPTRFGLRRSLRWPTLQEVWGERTKHSDTSKWALPTADLSGPSKTERLNRFGTWLARLATVSWRRRQHGLK